jgi:hypothetical protein
VRDVVLGIWAYKRHARLRQSAGRAVSLSQKPWLQRRRYQG